MNPASPAESTTPYDSFAWFYDRYWAGPLQNWQQPALEKLLFSQVPPESNVLDLCCGAGHFAHELSERGYRATGVDSSSEMLRLAREKAPETRFLQADATSFVSREPVDAVVCLFDSLNHVLDDGDVLRVFRNVHASLKTGGVFVFDINTEAAYGERWGYSSYEIQPDHCFILRGSYDPATRIGVTEITMFRLLDTWQRNDTAIRQRPWEISEIEAMLQAAGFTGISAKRAIEDLGMSGHYGIGRVFFRACSR